MNCTMSNRNVVMFGESGSGKSSLVNLILGQKKARVSDTAIGCTFNFEKFETPNFSLYDTVGLSEGAQGTIKQEFAIEKLIDLLKSLEAGVSLLVFVIEKGRIKKSLNENYKLFVDKICMGKVPVVLVITRCEMENEPGTWWEQNKIHFDKYGMKFNAVVSGSALEPCIVPQLMRPIIKTINYSTVAELLEAIRSNALEEPWKVNGGWNNWFYAIMKFVGKLIGIHTRDKMSDLFRSLGYDSIKAFEMANAIGI